ncbi:MAG: glycosyltransferase [Deltaproteobacteria bacterium]|jgi:glycosyltransferase involved in cell wall biosynthesis|nr:glycosyltransferase [Deltaproteobacteria bacterium]
MTTTPAVSIIMNCLNCAADLPAALAGVRAQSFQDWEIIFWDNASTDVSPGIARAFGPKLRYFRSRETVPLGAARNLALREAEGRYIAFLDCDDVWLAEKVAGQVALFEDNPRLGLVCTDTEIFAAAGVLGRVFARTAPARGRVFGDLMRRQWISMSSAMLRAQALHGLDHWFDEGLELCEEADLFYRIAHDWELDYVDAPLTRWRVHGANTTFKKFGQFAQETLYILDKHRRMYPGYEEEHGELVELLTRRAAFQRGVALWRDGRGAEARAAIAPYAGGSAKFRLFQAASYLPGGFFEILSRLYFALPGWLRR